jgi:uncharacterized membrane protein YidH (DUF202 family)
VKPGDFLLGVLDFFAILLPGMIATWLVGQYVPRSALRDAISFGLEGEANAWAVALVFLLSSYTLGHFVFMMGARLDGSYDSWRRRAKPRNRDKTYEAAKALQTTVSRELIAGEFTTLKWARTYIQVKAPHARAEIDRLEADQKFFRSLVVVSVALAAHFMLGEGAPVVGAAAVVMAVLSYLRYVEQRWKMTELIYATAVIVHKTNATTLQPAPVFEE